MVWTGERDDQIMVWTGERDDQTDEMYKSDREKL